MTGKRVFPASGFRNGTVNRLSTTLAQVGAINLTPSQMIDICAANNFQDLCRSGQIFDAAALKMKH